MNVPLIVAGSLAVLGALVHGAAGELLVMRRVSRETLPPTRFGGARMTLAMLHVSWHIATVAFLILGIALLVVGWGGAPRAVGVVAAGAFTGFAAVVVGLGAATTRSPRSLYRHPGPLALTATAALAWLGAL